MPRRLDPDQVKADIGRRIAELRINRGQTQAQLAEEAACAVQYLQRVEKGRNMRVETLVRFANLFHVNVADLFAPPATRAPRRRGRPSRRPRPAG